MTSDVIAQQPSTSQSPDLDWSQVRETVRMLHLAVAQIDMAMRDSDSSMDTLSQSFTSMVDNINSISTAVADIPDEAKGIQVRDDIQHHCDTVTSGMHSSIVAFQFYDKLTQRLQHVSESLSALSELVGDTQRLYSPVEWSGLQERILASYSTTEEVAMFDAMLNGESVESALQLYQASDINAADNDAGDIELF
ncbi:MAG: hypothetical protein MI754_10030 [Chromatiales bacterium]|nr:hypothetical protein [Chromatiales bacterium]